MKKIFPSLLIATVLFGAAFAAFSYYQDQPEQVAKQEAIAILEKMPSYKTNKDYLHKALEIYHPAAFEGSYFIHKDETNPSLEKGKYMNLLFVQMIGQAKQDHQDALAKELKEYYISAQLSQK